MNRRWIFGLVTAALLMNLAIGAQIYLSSPKTAHGTDAAEPNLQLIADVLNRTETAMPQARCFNAMELALTAQAKAEKAG